MKFERLVLRNWRNFKEVDVQLADRVFIVGQNASGKSNFLDVFRFLHDLVMPGGGFIISVKERGGISALRWFNATKNPNIEIEVTVRDAKGTYWCYGIVFGRDKTQTLTLKKETVRKRINDDREWEYVLKRPNKDDKDDPSLLKQTHIEQRAASGKFRSIVEVFRSVRYVHLSPQILRRPEVRRALPSEQWLGTDLIQRMAKTNKRRREARLKRISEMLSHITSLRIEGMSIKTDSEGAHLEIKCRNWRKHDIYHTERLLSDGTLKVLGLLWSLLEEGGPLLWEELEQSLHPAVVRGLPGFIARMQAKSRYGGRQIMMTTHSPDLLFDKGIRAEEILLLIPAESRTDVKRGVDVGTVVNLLGRGEIPGEVVMNYTQPKQPLLIPDL